MRLGGPLCASLCPVSPKECREAYTPLYTLKYTTHRRAYREAHLQREAYREV